MPELLSSVTNGLLLAKPFAAALAIIAALTIIGDRGSKLSLDRNSPCLATICIFTFALGTGLTTWLLLLKPLLNLFGVTIPLSYSLMLMYGAFWLLVGVMIATKKLVYDEYRRHGNRTPF